jgi:hypothetical protein
MSNRWRGWWKRLRGFKGVMALSVIILGFALPAWAECLAFEVYTYNTHNCTARQYPDSNLGPHRGIAPTYWNVSNDPNPEVCDPANDYVIGGAGAQVWIPTP